MGKPKKQTSNKRTNDRRGQIRLKLAEMVNRHSPVKVFTTKKQSGKKFAKAK